MDDIPRLRRNIQSFDFHHCSLGSQGFNRVLLQLFGFAGHGKSSFINSCKYVWDDGEFCNIAKAGRDDGARTTERISYELTKTITLVDNRGCSKMDDYEKGEIFAQLGGSLNGTEWAMASAEINGLRELLTVARDLTEIDSGHMGIWHSVTAFHHRNLPREVAASTQCSPPQFPS
ncbi:Hypothetical predicted protein [Pelobates cultripes]|nr:Hypothetical predicted protein [Pelobates cultripes]